jgi:hypothetical protein
MKYTGARESGAVGRGQVPAEAWGAYLLAASELLGLGPQSGI